MCEGQSPALSNSSIPANPAGSPPHAGFRSAQPHGLATSSSGPILSGWPRLIAWDDFRDRDSRPRGTAEDAQIDIVLQPARVSVERDNGQFKLGNVTFRMSVNRSNSWVVTERKSASLLAHEQGHYDISGICYRDLVAELQHLRTSSQRQLARETRRLMQQYDRTADALSAQYDSDEETDHGRNRDRQQAWETRIQDCIQNGSTLAAPP